MKVRIALAALAGAAALATAGLAATATGASAGTVPIPAPVSHITYASRGCAGGQLSATLTGGYRTWGNNRELVLTLTNTSSRACSLSGYPGLQLLNNRYQPLPTYTVQVPGRTSWSGQAVLLPGRSVTADITFSVRGPYYPAGIHTWPFYQGRAAYLAVTLPGAYPVYPVTGQQPYGQPTGQLFQPRFVLPIPGGPVRIVQDRLSETPLMGYFPVTW